MKRGVQIGPWVIGAGGLLGATLLAGKFSGLIREMELAATFGVSSRADVAVLLLTLPDLLVNLLLSGGLGAALIPRMHSIPERNANILFMQTFLLVFLIFGLLSVSFLIRPDIVFSLLAPGLEKETLPPTAAVVGTAIAIPLAALSGVTTAGLNSQNRFFLAGLGTLIFNIVVIAALAAGSKGGADTLALLGVGIALGSILRLTSQLVAIPSGWFKCESCGYLPDKRFVLSFVIATVSASLMLLVPVIVRALASMTSPGGVSALNYTSKLVDLPTGVLVSGLATVAMARLSEYRRACDFRAAREELHVCIHRALTNAIGASFLIAYFAHLIVEVLFGRGMMDSQAIARVANLTQILIFGLPFLALSSVAIADLNSEEKHGLVLKATVGCMLALPILVLPGILNGSESLLAAAVIGFQLLHAISLMWLCRLLSPVGRDWINYRLIAAIVIVFGILAITIVTDLLIRSCTSGDVFSRHVLAIVGMGAMIVLPQYAEKYLKRTPKSS
jgi:putative peptidoglycan lipid II flippase